MSEETKTTAKIMLAIMLILAILFIIMHKATAKPMPEKEPECVDTLDKKWETCYDHGIAYGCLPYCGRMVIMFRGRVVFR
jgi:hypothetical protein